MAVVIYSEKDGVFLGVALGLGFWSKLDPVGQEYAATFESEQQAEDFMATWESGRPADVRFVQVEPDDKDHASIEACVRAGLPAWSADISATASPNERADLVKFSDRRHNTETLNRTASRPSEHVVALVSAVDKLEQVHARFRAQMLTSVGHSREREACIVTGLTALAAHYGVSLRQPLQIDSRGDFMLVAVRPEETSPAPTFGSLVDVLNKYHPRTGVPGYTNTLDPSNSWGYLNHFEAEKMIVDQASLLKS